MFEGIKALVRYASKFPKLLTTIKDTRMFAKYENWCKKLQDKILKRRDKKTLRELEKDRLIFAAVGYNLGRLAKRI